MAQIPIPIIILKSNNLILILVIRTLKDLVQSAVLRKAESDFGSCRNLHPNTDDKSF